LTTAVRLPRSPSSRSSPPFGSRLLGRPGEDVDRLALRMHVLLSLCMVVANLIGAAAVIVLTTAVLPDAEVVERPELAILNLAIATVFVVVAVTLALLWGRRQVLRRLRWLLVERRAPTEAEQRATLRLPAVLLRVQVVGWLAGLAFFTTLNGVIDPGLITHVGLTVAFGGAVTCTNAYLLSELVLRPVAARALAAGPPRRQFVPGVVPRALLGWLLGTAAPVIGLMIVAVAALIERDVSTNRLAVTILALGAITVGFGLIATLLAARAIADPIRSLRRALARVERGDLDAEVPVYDGTEIGLLQDGFNRMLAGLRERERVQDLFGRHVGADVARAALERGVELGGATCEVGVLFVDIVGSTTLAATRTPAEVVALLNRFFAVVVDVVDRHHGMINKFEGDAALAVFGAPIPVPDHGTCALAAARSLAARLREEVPECEAGIGVAVGTVVAGNIGEARRFEYTVIGDPVNEAARLTELAKDTPGRVLASAAAVDRASPDEAHHWRHGEAVTLRGRTEPTVLATPTAGHTRT
jgi:adenylate cyclase